MGLGCLYSLNSLNPLPVNKKHTIGVTVTDEMRNRVKRIAEEKHWSVSQTLGLFMEAYWDKWEQDMGIADSPVQPKEKE